MKQNKKLISLVLLLNLANVNFVSSYSQVLTQSSQSGGPKLFKSLNTDLQYFNTFNTNGQLESSSELPEQLIAHEDTWQGGGYNQPHQVMVATASVTESSSPIFVTPISDGFNNSPIDSLASPQNGFQEQQEAPTNWQEASAQQPTWLSDDQKRTEQEVVQLSSAQQTRPNHEATIDADFQPLGQMEQVSSTGRALDYRTQAQQQHRGSFFTPPMRNTQPNAKHNSLAYKSQLSHSPSVYNNRQSGVVRQRRPTQGERPNSRGRVAIMDRYSPGEAVASSTFKKQREKHKKMQINAQKNIIAASATNPGSASSNNIQTYVPPKDLYSFPPNINAKYPSPAQDPKAAVPSSMVNSYIAPPSGPLTNSDGYPVKATSNGYQYTPPSKPKPDTNSHGYFYSGPVNPNYSPNSDDATPDDNGKENSASDGNDDTIGVLPASAMDDNDDSADHMPMPEDMHHDHDHGHDHDHDHLTAYEDDKEYPTPPPGWLEEHPESAHEPPSMHHDHDHDFPTLDYINDHHHHHHPQLIYDDAHHHSHDHDMPQATPPPPPLPEPNPMPPPEARVKKYSYFYIGRKLWYIPLYFTLWFSFYVLWLIVKSIARHKVNLPNHYVSRRSVRQSHEFNFQEYINQLTIDVLSKIESFNSKYQK